MAHRQLAATPRALRLFALVCALAAASLQYIGLAQVPITSNLTPPKRPQSGYFRFMNQKRVSYAAEHPGASAPDIAKAMGKLWKELSPEDKAPFEKESQEAKQRYEVDLQEFIEAGGVLPKRKSKKDEKKPAKPARGALAKKKSKKDKDQKRAKPAVKRPPSAYILYTMAERPNYVDSNPDTKAPEIMKALAKSWKELGEGEKQKFVHQAEEAKAKYKGDLEALKAAGESEEA